MNTLKTLLAAASIFAVTGAANALTVDVTNGIDVNGTITIDGDLESETLSQLFQFDLTNFNTGDSWIGNVLTPEGGTLPVGLDPIMDGDEQVGFKVTYQWGDASPNSNAASTGAATNWDWAQLIVTVDFTFNPTSIQFEARKYFGTGENDYTSTINTPLTVGTTPAVPVPAAAWMFGSGLIGLAGAARRRMKAA